MLEYLFLSRVWNRVQQTYTVQLRWEALTFHLQLP